jgi:hypothetical protein
MFGMSNTSLNCSTSLAALNFSQTNNPDESDFTLCPSASTNDLVMMMLQNNGSFDQSMLTQHQQATLNSAHKRKHSTNEKSYFFNANHGAIDEDSSWPQL